MGQSGIRDGFFLPSAVWIGLGRIAPLPQLSVVRTTVPLCLGLLAFLMVFPASSSLPVLGDGALHARLMQDIAGSGKPIADISAPYPVLYHLMGGILFQMLGITGIKLISPLAIGVSTLVAYLIARELTGRDVVSLLVMPLVAFSPKVIWYGALIYMEPLQVMFVLLGVYAMLLSLKRFYAPDIALVALMVAGAALTKQVGLVMAVAAGMFFLINRMGLQRTGMLAALVSAFIVGPYVFMFFNSHALVKPPAIGPQELRERSAGPLGSLLMGDRWRYYPEWAWELEQEVDATELYSQGTQAHESRHIFGLALGEWDKFLELHTLFPYSFFGYGEAPKPWLITALNASLVAGYILAMAWAVRSQKWRAIALVLLVTYPVLSVGSDTRRYFLYVPVLLAFLPLLPFVQAHSVAEGLRWRNRAAPVAMAVAFLALGLIAVGQLYQMGVQEERVVRRAGILQEYSPSAGGIPSIAVTGAWIRDHSGPDDVVFATSAYEWEYYAQRPNLWFQGLNYLIYFLPPERIDHYLGEAGARYVVIRDNQIVADEDWAHVGYMPQSFYDNVLGLYPLAFTSPHGDIKVYEVTTKEGGI